MSQPLKILCIVGTRPEFIKVYPVYKLLFEQQFKNRVELELDVKLVFSGQHIDLLEDLEEFFEVKPDFRLDLSDLNKETENRLSLLSSKILKEASELFIKEKPDLIFLQGDTVTAQQCAQAAFFQKINIAHIEAGLRTHDLANPFPEEFARRVISQIADLNFAPDKKAQNNLEAEKILFDKKSFNFHTGNTVIDTLDLSMKKINDESFDWSSFRNIKQAFSNEDMDVVDYLENRGGRQFILVTAHRRENHGKALQNLANAIFRIADKFKNDDVEFVISVHKNPGAREAFEELYSKCLEAKLENVYFLDSINYPCFLRLMTNCFFIVTDSGGIQEEAPYLSKPVLIFRNNTERLEGLNLGLSKLIGTEEHRVHGELLDMIISQETFSSMVKKDLQPYGDGLAASRIVDVSLLYLKDKA